MADFVLQTDKMALNKSSNNGWLLIHVLTYSVTMFLLVSATKYLQGNIIFSNAATAHNKLKFDGKE